MRVLEMNLRLSVRPAKSARFRNLLSERIYELIGKAFLIEQKALSAR